MKYKRYSLNKIEKILYSNDLKGDVDQKLYPFAYSYLYNLADMMGGKIEQVNELIEAGCIEIMCVSLLRGVNFKDAICIAGEFQQYSKESALTIITRLCDSSKLICEGDLDQCDNKNIRKGREDSGLKHALENLSDLPSVGTIEFNKRQIVRNPLISKILSKWSPDVYGYLEDEDVGADNFKEDNNDE